jgi:agmatinase
VSFRELYVHGVHPTLFGVRGDFNSAEYVVIGVPFDSTATGVPGQRYAPKSIREASIELETYHPGTNVDAEELEVFDAGDLPLVTCTDVLVKTVGKVVEEVFESGKKLITIGGDHFVSYPVLSTLARRISNLRVLVFDAHLDLRDEYPFGCKFSHATVFRRILEENRNVEVAYFKPRGWSREEYTYAKTSPRVFIIEEEAQVDDWLEKSERVYVTIDIDIVDPSFAPGTGLPEPLGITPEDLGCIAGRIFSLYSKRIVGLDLVEVNPLVDVNNITSRLAAKLLMHVLVNMARKSGP